jgi:hypothetical protein
MLTRVQYMLKMIRNMVIYNNLKHFEKIIKNGNKSAIINRGTDAFFKNRNNSCLIPYSGKFLLWQAKIKNKLKNRKKYFRTTLNQKIRYIIESNRFLWPQTFYIELWISESEMEAEDSRCIKWLWEEHPPPPVFAMNKLKMFRKSSSNFIQCS